MTLEPDKILNPSKSFSPGFRLWLKWLAGVFALLVVLVLVLPGRPQNGSDWLVASAYIVGVSIVGATFLLWLGHLFRWLRCWRNLRRVLFVVACAATLVALFYAEEDWRGWHAWARFQKQEEAQGVRFDFASVVPPPVPDDQNFALTPMVASSYAQMIDPTGHEIRPRNTNVVNRLSMHYWGDDTKYPDKLSNWTLGQRTDLAAFQQYYRTEAVQTNLFKFPAQWPSPAADVLQALSRFDADLAELHQDAQLPHSRFPLEYAKDNPWEILLPHLAALKCADQMLSLRATAELQTGHSETALADVKLQLRLTDSARTEPFLISHLVRLAMVQLTMQPVWEGLADHHWSEAQLAELEAELGRLDFLADYQACMRGDRVYAVREINFLRRNPGRYFEFSDSVLGADALVTPESDRTMSMFSAGHLVPSGWYYQNQMRYLRDIEKFYRPAADVQGRVFLPALFRQGDAWVTNQCQHPSPYNILECLFFQWPLQFETGVKFAHGQSSVDLARVAVALERCRLAQGKFPDSLAALAPQYLNPVPHDIIGGQPLHYRLTPGGQFVLYSIGWNERDDGGVVVMGQGKSPCPDLKQGDWVWQYP